MDGKKAKISPFRTHQFQALRLDRLENPTTVHDIEEAAKRANRQKKSEKQGKKSEKQGKKSDKQGKTSGKQGKK